MDMELMQGAFEMINSGGLFGVVMSGLADAVALDRRIEELIEQHPERRAELWDSFKTAGEIEALGNREMLWKPHREEIVRRVAKGQDLGLRTDAEVLAILLETSVATPLTTDGSAACWKLFARLFPEEAKKIQTTLVANDVELGPVDYTPRESYPGAADHLIDKIRRTNYPVKRHQPDPERWMNLQACPHCGTPRPYWGSQDTDQPNGEVTYHCEKCDNDFEDPIQMREWEEMQERGGQRSLL